MKRKTTIASLNNCFNSQFSPSLWVTERSDRIYVDTTLTGNNVTSGYTNHDAFSYPCLIVFFAPPCIDIYSRRLYSMPHVTIRIAGEFGADRDKACTSEVLSRVFHSSSLMSSHGSVSHSDIHKWHAHLHTSSSYVPAFHSLFALPAIAESLHSCIDIFVSRRLCALVHLYLHNWNQY